MPDNDFQCEIKDMMESMQRFTITNKKNVVFVGAVLAFDDKEQTKMKKNTGAVFAFGSKFHLRGLLNDLRNNIEDNADEGEFVNL